MKKSFKIPINIFCLPDEINLGKKGEMHKVIFFPILGYYSIIIYKIQLYATIAADADAMATIVMVTITFEIFYLLDHQESFYYLKFLIPLSEQAQTQSHLSQQYIPRLELDLY